MLNHPGRGRCRRHCRHIPLSRVTFAASNIGGISTSRAIGDLPMVVGDVLEEGSMGEG